MFKKILVAIDSLETSNHILAAALFMAKASNAELMLLHVLSPFEEGYPNMRIQIINNSQTFTHQETITTYLKQREKFESQSLELLRSHLVQAIAMGIKAEMTQNFGDPKLNICDLARTWGADLIVMGRRANYDIKDAIHGSVSSYVLHNSLCPVLTLQHQE
ncbi:universal stress protein [Phormidium sp. LEGE 05292]|uniref:universal stress protein n=1 Tax=[Phormidium] sp. LEGE 05292 TaxID=767427 RepID=UPI00187E1321|nr:universal stress protein [Phormidium sp. LEGE 05292]MBE9229130.1 universal stress protein [Phormidium sp. LEGE 05292]